MGKGVLKEKRNDLSAKVAPWCNSAICVLKWPVAHTTRRADRRQECRERGYYHLHRQLDDLLLLHTIFRFFSVVRWCGGQPLSRLEARDYSAAESSALRVTSSPPKLGGVRGGLNAGKYLLCHRAGASSDHPALRAPLLTQEGKRLLFRQKTPYLDYSRTSVPPRPRAPDHQPFPPSPPSPPEASGCRLVS